MISNVHLNASGPYKGISKKLDSIQQNEQTTAVTSTADKIEISAEAKSATQAIQIASRTPASQYFMEVFSVNFWSRGVSEAFEMALEALRASIVADTNDLKYFESLVGESLTDEYAKANLLIDDFNTGTSAETASTVDITVD